MTQKEPTNALNGTNFEQWLIATPRITTFSMTDVWLLNDLTHNPSKAILGKIKLHYKNFVKIRHSFG